MRFMFLASAGLLLVSCGEGEQRAEAQRGAQPSLEAPSLEAPPSRPALEHLTELSREEIPSALRAAPGRVLLVNLWSTWCRPCMEEMPELVALARRHRASGLGTMLISMDIASSRADALRFLVEQGAPSPSYIRMGRDADFIPAMHADWSGTLPATILFDQDRRPQHVWVGEVPMDELERAVRQMLSEGNE